MNDKEKEMLDRLADLLPKMNGGDMLMLEGFLQGLAFNCQRREDERKTA